MKVIDQLLLKASESATAQVSSYKGYGDQGPDMNARAVMEHGKPETPRPHKTTQGDVEPSGTDRFSKGAGILDLLQRAKQPAWNPPMNPRGEDDEQIEAWIEALRQYAEQQGYKNMTRMPYEPGGAPYLLQRGNDWHMWDLEDPSERPVSLEDVYGEAGLQPEDVMRTGPGIVLTAEDRITAPKIEQPVPKTPSQAVLTAKKIAPASLPIHREMSGNRMSFAKPYRTGGMVKLF